LEVNGYKADRDGQTHPPGSPPEAQVATLTSPEELLAIRIGGCIFPYAGEMRLARHMAMTIMVIGNAGIDRTLQFENLPRPGESLTAISERVDLGGKGANQAVAARRCGAEVVLVTSLDRDPNGNRVRESLRDDGVLLVELEGGVGPTDEYTILVDREGRNMVVSRPLRAADLPPRAFEYAIAGISERDHLILQGSMSLAAAEYCASEARRRGATVVINPSPLRYAFDRIWPVVDVVILNEIEAGELGKSNVPTIDARSLLSRGPSMVIVTLGAQGALLLSERGEHCQPGPLVEAVDTTGAGDVFCGAFVAGWALQLEPRLALEFAVTLASMSVTRHGARSSCPSRAEAQHVLQNIHQYGHLNDDMHRATLWPATVPARPRH
jgi:ribokinase